MSPQTIREREKGMIKVFIFQFLPLSDGYNVFGVVLSIQLSLLLRVLGTPLLTQELKSTF